MYLWRLLGFVLIVIVGFWIATQFIAHSLGSSLDLGASLITFNGVELYLPYKVIGWMYYYGSAYSNQFDIAAGIIVISVILGFAYLFILSLQDAKKTKNIETMPYGTAKWAGEADLQKANLFENKGVVFGIDSSGRYLRDNSDRHVKVFAPTRSGKGVSVVVPTLFTWSESVVVFDPKGENYVKTAGYRSKFSEVIYFNPTLKSSAKFNPLLEVRKGDNEVKDAQNIADMTVDPDGKGLADHWARTSHSLLVGAILHVLYAEKRKSLAGVADLLSNPKMTIEETLSMMMTTAHLPDGSTHEVVARTARDMLNKSFEERSGVLSTAMAHLTLYRDPILANATETSDFRITDFLDSKIPKSLYISIPGSDITRLRPLIRLMINQFCKRLTESLVYEDTPLQEPFVKRATSLITGSDEKRFVSVLKPRKQRLLLLMDEFPTLGKLEFFETSLAYMAQYGLKAMLISQSVNQLVKEYTEHNSIVDNCHIRIFHAPNTQQTADLISKMLGQTTAKNKHKNFGGSRFGLVLGHVTEAEQQTGRPLLTSGEVKELGEDKQIVFVTNVPPILCHKLFYYKDPSLSLRQLIAPKLETLKTQYKEASHDWNEASEQGINDIFNFEIETKIDPQADLPFHVTGRRRRPHTREELEEKPDLRFVLGED